QRGSRRAMRRIPVRISRLLCSSGSRSPVRRSIVSSAIHGPLDAGPIRGEDGRVLIEIGRTRDIEADVCIIGVVPAGLCIANALSARQKTVVLLESGFFGPHADTQSLTLARTRGPIADMHPFYLAMSRLRLFGGSQLMWGGWCTPLLDLDLLPR